MIMQYRWEHLPSGHNGTSKKTKAMIICESRQYGVFHNNFELTCRRLINKWNQHQDWKYVFVGVIDDE